MFKHILAAVAALFLAAAAHAAVDVNKANQAELEAVKGIGPSLSTQIVGERKNGEFKDWSDFASRVKGVGERSAAKFSEAGLTVHGKPYAGPAPSASAKATAKTSGRGGDKKLDKAEKRGGAKKGAATGATST